MKNVLFVEAVQFIYLILTELFIVWSKQIKSGKQDKI